MKTTTQQDRDFISNVLSSALLEDSIDYIINTFSAEEIYGKEVLEEWAEENDYIKNPE